MAIARTANPALNKNTFTSFEAVSGSQVMTLSGTVNRIAILLLLVLAGAFYTWRMAFQAIEADPQTATNLLLPWMIGGGIGGFIVAMITIFKKTAAPYTAPLYAVLEGLFLGGISAFFEYRHPGIVINAVVLTFGILFALLIAYRSGLIKPTENFKLGVFAATGGVVMLYFISFILNFFGVGVGYLHNSSLLSIGISVVIIIIAALNLVLDFDFIEQGAASSAPKYMEWYAAFGLMVTLVWLYLEILRLLSKIASRN
ncbi:MAG: Bax inhibitor-1/YccA family protein [Bacteroidales bacterium]|nr:Bax inhibitor-1/YccA family protein [Bacteroidales bacterium]